jgi:hypothetical protein
MRFASFLLVALGSLAGIAWAAEPVNVSLDDLQRYDSRYAGMLVRVHGMIGPCNEASCPICPSWEKMSYNCSEIALWKDDAASAAMDRLYSFTEVTLTGRIPVFDPDDPGDCFNNRGCRGWIVDVEVERLHERRSVIELPETFRGEPVSLASEAEQLQLRAVFRASRRTREILDRNVPTVVYLEIEESEIPAGKSHVLHASLCWETDRPGIRVPPSRRGDLYWNSFANGYVCAHANKDGETDWKVYDPDQVFE